MKELELLAKNLCPKMIGISETKPKSLTTDLPESILQLDGYTLHYNNLERNKGRGVALYVHNSMEATKLDLPNKTEESLWLS